MLYAQTDSNDLTHNRTPISKGRAIMASLRVRWRAGRTNQGLMAFLFLLPFVLLFVVFRAGPVVASLVLSFMEYDGLSRPVWIGLANYENILFGTEAATRLFWQSVANTLYFTVGEVGLEMVTGLSLAVLVNSRLLRARPLWRTAYYLPVVTSLVAASMIWVWLYHPQAGLFNQVLQMVGLPRLKWLSDPNLAMPSIILMAVWQGAGWSMVIYLAGLQGIPETLYEAAKIDGATAWQQFRYLTLPLLAPVTLFVVIISCISALQVFSQVFVMTGGGPLNATTTVTHQIWINGFRFFRLGFASAMSFLLFLVILVISVVNNRLFGGSVEY
jgi:ABC-type sugar transport system permease subunit